MAGTLKELLARADALKAEIDKLRPLSPEQELRIFQKLRLDWNYHSNAIEGNKLTQGETTVFLLEGLTAQGKPLKDHLDIKGHNAVIDFLLDFIRQKAELTEADIRGMHKILLVEPYKVTAFTPDGRTTEKWIKLGEYKTEPNQVKTLTGQIKQFVLPQETPAKMSELMDWYRDATRKRDPHPIIIAAFVHHAFASIHPFDDGNGRMARILMNLILMQNGYPPVVIKTTERDRYMAALGRADLGEQEDFQTFIAEKQVASLELCLKGARGETVEEDDDIDKKIALLKQKLHHIPDPILYSPAEFVNFARNDFPTLASNVLTKLAQFNELFAEFRVHISVDSVAQQWGGPDMEPIIDGTIQSVQKRMGAGTVSTIQLVIHWATFKKAGVRDFDYQKTISINFRKLQYVISWESGQIELMYSERITKEIANSVAKAIAEEFLKFISSHRTEH